MIKWKTSKREMELIHQIVTRARRLADRPLDPMTLDMDITATHANGCKLNLDRLLTFPDFDFAHDVFGIQRHINRETGQLENCFVPRCAAA